MAEAGMTPQVWNALRQLAFQDGERAAVLTHLAQARERAAHDVVLEAARLRLQQAEQAGATAAKERRSCESTIQDLNANIVRAEARLASGRLSSEREVAAAMNEIAATKETIGEVEAAWMDFSTQEELLSNVLPAERAAFAAAEREAAIRQAATQEMVAETEARLAQIDALRREAAKTLPAEVRDRYRALFSRSNGRPFAFAEAGECSHCRKAVPASAMQALRSHSGVPNCPFCGRLLMLS